MDISIVIPTWNRSSLLHSLLDSLAQERQQYAEQTEVIVVDSSEGAERENIIASCKEFDALYLPGEQSVRKKRNLGVKSSRFELILFIDSDVVVAPGLLQAHADAYQKGAFVGAAQGLTEFVGRDTFLWKCTKLSKLVWSFSNAKRFPYQAWSITNNLSVRRDVFDQIGGFTEDFPFKLGGDDLEMSYRVNRAGFKIASAPEAIAYHSKETWNHVAAINDRTKRWGTIESYVSELHPELYKLVVPPNYVFELLAAVVLLIVALITHSLAGWILLAAFFPLLFVQRWVKEMLANRSFINPIHLLVACWINARYEVFRILGHLKKGKHFPSIHGFVFDGFQARGSFFEDSRRLRLMLFDYLALFFVTGVVLYV